MKWFLSFFLCLCLLVALFLHILWIALICLTILFSVLWGVCPNSVSYTCLSGGFRRRGSSCGQKSVDMLLARLKKWIPRIRMNVNLHDIHIRFWLMRHLCTIRKANRLGSLFARGLMQITSVGLSSFSAFVRHSWEVWYTKITVQEWGRGVTEGLKGDGSMC